MCACVCKCVVFFEIYCKTCLQLYRRQMFLLFVVDIVDLWVKLWD